MHLGSKDDVGRVKGQGKKGIDVPEVDGVLDNTRVFFSFSDPFRLCATSLMTLSVEDSPGSKGVGRRMKKKVKLKMCRTLSQ